MKRVLKWVVPVDGERHDIGGGAIVSIGHQGCVDEVVVWTEEDSERHRTVPARVYGTGHVYPDTGVALGSVSHMAGTVLNAGGRTNLLQQNVVWHLVVFPGA